MQPDNPFSSNQVVTRLAAASFGIVSLHISAASAIEHTLTEEGDAALSSEAPHIPEPMVFDMVRPLGVKQGDAEVNVLSEHSLRTGHTGWAPEFEFGWHVL